MPATKTHDIVATVGKYKGDGGEEKKRYLNVGSAFTDDQGRISLKLDAVPCSPDWSGWLSLYPVERDEQRPAPRQRLGQQRTTPQEAQRINNAHRHQDQQQGQGDDMDDDIPF